MEAISQYIHYNKMPSSWRFLWQVAIFINIESRHLQIWNISRAAAGLTLLFVWWRMKQVPYNVQYHTDLYQAKRDLAVLQYLSGGHTGKLGKLKHSHLKSLDSMLYNYNLKKSFLKSWVLEKLLMHTCSKSKLWCYLIKKNKNK